MVQRHRDEDGQREQEGGDAERDDAADHPLTAPEEHEVEDEEDAEEAERGEEGQREEDPGVEHAIAPVVAALEGRVAVAMEAHARDPVGASVVTVVVQAKGVRRTEEEEEQGCSGEDTFRPIRGHFLKRHFDAAHFRSKNW